MSLLTFNCIFVFDILDDGKRRDSHLINEKMIYTKHNDNVSRFPNKFICARAHTYFEQIFNIAHFFHSFNVFLWL